MIAVKKKKIVAQKHPDADLWMLTCRNKFESQNMQTCYAFLDFKINCNQKLNDLKPRLNDHKVLVNQMLTFCRLSKL